MTRRKSIAGHVARLYKLSHDPVTDHVHLRVGSAKAEPRLWIPRRSLRAFTDHLHDFADDLDRKDRDA